MKKEQYFSANINGKNTIGQIQQEDGEFYLCQNEIEGMDCINKLGFDYSWCVRKGTLKNLQFNDVRDFKIITELQFKKLFKGVKKPIPIIIGCYQVTYKNKKYVFGCGEITLTKQQIKSFVDFYESNKKNIELLEMITKRVDIEDLPKVISQTKTQILK